MQTVIQPQTIKNHLKDFINTAYGVSMYPNGTDADLELLLKNVKAYDPRIKTLKDYVSFLNYMNVNNVVAESVLGTGNKFLPLLDALALSVRKVYTAPVLATLPPYTQKLEMKPLADPAPQAPLDLHAKTLKGSGLANQTPTVQQPKTVPVQATPQAPVIQTPTVQPQPTAVNAFTKEQELQQQIQALQQQIQNQQVPTPIEPYKTAKSFWCVWSTVSTGTGTPPFVDFQPVYSDSKVMFNPLSVKSSYQQGGYVYHELYNFKRLEGIEAFEILKTLKQ